MAPKAASKEAEVDLYDFDSWADEDQKQKKVQAEAKKKEVQSSKYAESMVAAAQTRNVERGQRMQARFKAEAEARNEEEGEVTQQFTTQKFKEYREKLNKDQAVIDAKDAAEATNHGKFSNFGHALAAFRVGAQLQSEKEEKKQAALQAKKDEDVLKTQHEEEESHYDFLNRGLTAATRRKRQTAAEAVVEPAPEAVGQKEDDEEGEEAPVEQSGEAQESNKAQDEGNTMEVDVEGRGEAAFEELDEHGLVKRKKKHRTEEEKRQRWARRHDSNEINEFRERFLERMRERSAK